MPDAVNAFYQQYLPGNKQSQGMLQAPCPFCTAQGKKQAGILLVFLNPESFFHGYFRCLNHCIPGGFPLHFAKLLGISASKTPGFEPDREYFGRNADYPAKNINADIIGFVDKLTEDQQSLYHAAGVSPAVLREMRVGYNGRYLVYPYIQMDGNCYAARCIHPDRPEDYFWYGDEHFAQAAFRIFNMQDIDRCENGALFLVEEEKNLLALRELGFPGIAVPTANDLDHLDPLRFTWIRTLFLWVNNNAESEAKARAFATRVGFKTRIVRWPEDTERNLSLFRFAEASGTDFRKKALGMIREARAFSPFSSPSSEYHTFQERLSMESGDAYSGLRSGFLRLDNALDGIHGINVMGGTPKAGKSTFFIQIASDMALRKLPVIYYDFENGRQKIYTRILSRLSRLSVDQIRNRRLDQQETERLRVAMQQLQGALRWLRVVNDRKLTPELMRRHIDFLRHETNADFPIVVIDSLHKLPFKDIAQQRSGIDGWLRQLEAIRDEMAVSFLVISELERIKGQFEEQPTLGSFKGSGDIGYSADNAMVLVTRWDPFEESSPEDRINELWLVATREQSPGKISDYKVDYPYWGFKEV